MITNIALFISKAAIWFALIAIIGYGAYKAYQFYKSFKTDETKKTENINQIKEAVTQPPIEEKDNPLKRIKRGFGVMTQKIQDSNFAKNINSNENDLGLPKMQDFINDDSDALGLNEFYTTLEEPKQKNKNKEDYWNPTGINF